MKYQVLFSLINNEKVFINVVCCSRGLVLFIRDIRQWVVDLLYLRS